MKVMRRDVKIHVISFAKMLMKQWVGKFAKIMF